jgi:hypothetical protein
METIKGFSDKNNNGWDATDTSLLSNYMKNATDDINQTNKSVIVDKTATEANPIVRPFTDSGSAVYNAGGLVGEIMLANRWVNMKDVQQRRNEMGLAGVIEAAALLYSGEPATIQYGFNF